MEARLDRDRFLVDSLGRFPLEVLLLGGLMSDEFVGIHELPAD